MSRVEQFCIGPKLYDSNEAITATRSESLSERLNSEESLKTEYELVAGGDVPPHELYFGQMRTQNDVQRNYNCDELKHKAQLAVTLQRQSEVAAHLAEGIENVERLANRFKNSRNSIVDRLVVNENVLSTIDESNEREIEMLLQQEAGLEHRCAIEIRERGKHADLIEGQFRKLNACVAAIEKVQEVAYSLDQRMDRHLNETWQLVKDYRIEVQLAEKATTLEAHQLKLRNEVNELVVPQAENLPINLTAAMATGIAGQLADAAIALEGVVYIVNNSHMIPLIGQVSQSLRNVAQLICQEVPTINLEAYLENQVCNTASEISLNSSSAYESAGMPTVMSAQFESAESDLSYHDDLRASSRVAVEPTESEIRTMFPSTTVINDQSFVPPPVSPMSVTAMSSTKTAVSPICPTAVEIQSTITAKSVGGHTTNSVSHASVHTAMAKCDESDVEPSVGCDTAVSHHTARCDTAESDCITAKEIVSSLATAVLHGAISTSDAVALATAHPAVSFDDLITAVSEDADLHHKLSQIDLITARSTAATPTPDMVVSRSASSWRSILSCRSSSTRRGLDLGSHFTGPVSSGGAATTATSKPLDKGNKGFLRRFLINRRRTPRANSPCTNREEE